MDLAIVLAVHNRNDLRLKNCLKTFLYQETTHSYEIYIVDYASDDNLRSMLQELGSDKILYLSTDEDLGKPRAYNVAIRAANADIICVTDGCAVVPMQTVEAICTGTGVDTLLAYLRRPYFIPEVIWQDPTITPADYERLRVAPTDWLDENMHIGIGPSKKPLFAVQRQHLIEIGGYDEEMGTDEDVDIVRRLLQRGCIMADMSQLIDVAHQPSTTDRIDKSILGLQERRDLRAAEASASLWRNDPIRNAGREWGQL